MVDPSNEAAYTSEHCIMIGPALGVSPANGTSQNKSTTLIANKRSTTVSLTQIGGKNMFDINIIQQDKKQGSMLHFASMKLSSR